MCTSPGKQHPYGNWKQQLCLNVSVILPFKDKALDHYLQAHNHQSNFLISIMSGPSTQTSTRVIDCAGEKFYLAPKWAKNLLSALPNTTTLAFWEKRSKFFLVMFELSRGKKMRGVDFRGLMVLTFSIKCTHVMLDVLWDQLSSYIYEYLKFVSWRYKICGS